MRLYYSIYETALRNGVPRPVIEEVVRVYSYDVDFQRKVHPGDSFEILYASEDENAGDYGKFEVFYALLTTGGETRKYFRHQTTDDNTVDYYDESGKSAKKFLIRKPVADGNSPPASAAATIQSSATPRCIPAWTGAPRWERRSSPPATASSSRQVGKAAMENTSASVTPTAIRPPMATCRGSPAAWSPARKCARVR